MKSSTPASTANSSLDINGTYIKILKSKNLLFVVQAIIQFAAVEPGSGNNIIRFTYGNNTTVDISFLTEFRTTGSGITWISYMLPLEYKSVALIQTASVL